MRFKLKRTLTALLLGPASLAVQAGEATLLPPVVVSGLPTARAELEAPAAIGLVNATSLGWGQAQIALSESLAEVPGLSVRNRYNYAQDLQIQSRGFGARSTFGVRGLQLRLDGIPLTAPDGQGQAGSLLISALDRIEVLRGPLAYGYGNASGGVIAAFSAPPPAQTTLTAGYTHGNDGTWRGAVSVAGQARQNDIGYRIEAARFMTDGYRDHSAARRDQFAATASYQWSDGQRLSLLVNTLSQPDAQDPLGLTRAQFEQNPQQADAAATNFNTRKSSDERIGGLRYAQALAGGEFEVLGYRSAREVEQFQSIPVAVQAAPSHSGGVIDLERGSHGLDTRYTRTFSWGTASAGLQAQQLDEDRRGFENFQGSTLGVRGNLRRDEDNRVENFDQFVSAEWQWAQRWSLLGALRHSAVKFVSADHYVVEGNPDDSGRKSFSATTPALAVGFSADAENRIYASWGRGFETPTFNELSYRPDGSSGLNFNLQAARSETRELGWKRALTGAGLLTLSAFHIESENEIVPASNSGGRASFQNAKGTRRVGAEASLRRAIGESLSLMLAADYIDAEFRETYSYTAAGNTQTVAKGNRIPGVAGNNAYLELAWRRGRPGWSAALDLRHSADVPVNDINSDAAESYRVVNARLVYQKPADWGSWSAFVRADNLLDETYAGSVIVNEGNSRFFESAPGRGGFAGVEFNFQP